MKLLDKDITTKEVLDWKGVHLLHFEGSSCSQKTRIFLNLKGIDWVSHPIDLVAQKNFEPWFLGINPRGLVPVLVHDGAVHIESNDILVYLDATFPTPALIPSQEHNEMIEGLKEEDDLHLDLRSLTMRFVLPKFLAQKKPAVIKAYEEARYTINGKRDHHKEIEIAFWNDYAEQGITDAKAKEAALKFKAVYDRLEDKLRESKYLCGSEITLLDVAWFIYTYRLSVAGYPFARLHPSVLKWFDGLAEKNEFSKELVTPLPLKVITKILHLVQNLNSQSFEQVTGL